jgi:hypothetical protein
MNKKWIQLSVDTTRLNVNCRPSFCLSLLSCDMNVVQLALRVPEYLCCVKSGI